VISPDPLFAVTAGILSIFTPCGYAVLPGYIAYLVGEKMSGLRAAGAGISATLGLITLFGAIGLIVSRLKANYAVYIPLLTLPSAIIILAMGALIVLNKPLPFIGLKNNLAVRLGLGGLAGSYVFGFSYGLSASGCTAPIFLATISYAIGASLADGFTFFSAYALGVGLPLILTAILVGEVKESLLAKIARVTPRLHMASGYALIVVGLYLIYYTYANRLPIATLQ